ncbi:hypothetical protein CF65_00495 [Aggregatibacter actinomycetemcomitans HK1651]|nr:hypothetical protein ANH9381_0500 [Aggregatibacter actinomycetemcomitans ANH9381]AHN71066.1 hypothetical protein CF65_00495 [Aggregatibacter actinomycetemcomitans HK1651]
MENPNVFSTALFYVALQVKCVDSVKPFHQNEKSFLIFSFFSFFLLK